MRVTIIKSKCAFIVQGFVDFLPYRFQFGCMYILEFKWRCKSSVGSAGVGGHAVTVQVLSSSQSSQNPIISDKVSNPTEYFCVAI